MSQENLSISLNDKLSEKLNELNQLNKEQSNQFQNKEAEGKQLEDKKLEEIEEVEDKQLEEVEQLEKAEDKQLEDKQPVEVEQLEEATDNQPEEVEQLEEATDKQPEEVEQLEDKQPEEVEQLEEAEDKKPEELEQLEEAEDKKLEEVEQLEEVENFDTVSNENALLKIEIDKNIELFYFYDIIRKYIIYDKNGDELISSKCKMSFKNCILNGKKENCLNFDNKINLKVLISDDKVKGFGFNKKLSLLSKYFDSKIPNLDIGRIDIF